MGHSARWAAGRADGAKGEGLAVGGDKRRVELGERAEERVVSQVEELRGAGGGDKVVAEEAAEVVEAEIDQGDGGSELVGQQPAGDGAGIGIAYHVVAEVEYLQIGGEGGAGGIEGRQQGVVAYVQVCQQRET